MARRDIPLGELAGSRMVTLGNPRRTSTITWLHRDGAQVIFHDFREFA